MTSVRKTHSVFANVAPDATITCNNLTLAQAMSLPSLRAVKAFSAVAQAGSFARAAVQLGISRSAVSHLVSDLERMVGVRLLDRSRGHIAATHDGKALLGALGDAVLRVEAAIEGLRVDRN